MPYYNLQRNLFLGGKRYNRRDNPVFIPDDKAAWVPASAVMVVEKPPKPAEPEIPSLRDFDMERKRVEAAQRIESAVNADEVEQARKKFKK